MEAWAAQETAAVNLGDARYEDQRAQWLIRAGFEKWMRRRKITV